MKTLLKITFILALHFALTPESLSAQLANYWNSQTEHIKGEGASEKEAEAFEISIMPSEPIFDVNGLFMNQGPINAYIHSNTFTPTSGIETRSHSGEIYERLDWGYIDGEHFGPNFNKIPAGDLNGNGFIDMIVSRYNVPDSRANDPEVLTDVTLVFFGGSFSTHPDVIIYDNVLPVGDLLGDGSAQLLGGRQDSEWRLHSYNGSDFSRVRSN